MPTYEYLCTQCKQEIEIVQKMSDPKITECPACHKDALQRIISTPNFHLKGSGWYATDFKKSPINKEQGMEEKAAPTEAKGNESSQKKSDDAS